MANNKNVSVAFRDGVPDEIIQAVFNELDAGAKEIVKDAKIKAPAVTGNMAARIRSKVTLKGNQIKGSIWTDSGYAAHVEFGTGLWGPKGDYIYPKNAKVMTWDDPGFDTEIFARRTTGQPPQPFLKPSIDQNVPKIIRALKDIESKIPHKGKTTKKAF